MKKFILFVVLTLVAVGVYVSWEAIVFLNRSVGTSGEVVLFEIHPGEPLFRVARRLEKENLVSDDQKFKIFARLTGKTNVRVGEYELRRDMYPAEILDIIGSGRSVEHQVTFQEGLNKFEIAQIFAAKNLGTSDEFLKLVDDRTFAKTLLGEPLSSLEGYLFPETYRVTKYTGAKGLIEKMVGRFKEVYQEIEPLKKTRLNRHALVTLASIVEKETGAPEERPIISSVYTNRLNKPMRLQADPTVLYGIWVETGEFKRNITKADLRAPTAYNTYTNNGLPAGPIANPGKEALLAAASPAQSDYLYFVSRNDGTHVFSTDYESHRKAVVKFQLNRSARQNKSWRDLSKRKNSPVEKND